MRIPAHFSSLADELALQSWVERKEFPRDDYFESIEDFKELLQQRHTDEGDDTSFNEGLAVMIGGALHSEGKLQTYAIEEINYRFQDPEEMGRIANAAGWVVLQRYERECKNGKWSPR